MIINCALSPAYINCALSPAYMTSQVCLPSKLPAMGSLPSRLHHRLVGGGACEHEQQAGGLHQCNSRGHGGGRKGVCVCVCVYVCACACVCARACVCLRVFMMCGCLLVWRAMYAYGIQIIYAACSTLLYVARPLPTSYTRCFGYFAV